MMVMIVIHLKTKMIMIIIHLQTSEYTFVNQYDNGDCATSWFFYCSSLNEKKNLLIQRGDCLQWIFCKQKHFCLAGTPFFHFGTENQEEQ